MFKILLIDRCHFTRTGLEEWLNHSGLFPHSLLVTSLNNLFLAKEHILQWKPALVIADLNGFQSDIHHLEQLSPLMAASENVPFISLHTGEAPEMSAFMQRFPVWASLQKTRLWTPYPKPLTTRSPLTKYVSLRIWRRHY